MAESGEKAEVPAAEGESAEKAAAAPENASEELQAEPQAAEQEKDRSRSRSSSSSSGSSSSGRSASKRARTDLPALKVGEQVEIYGLGSAAGQALNGQKGVLTQHTADKGRWEVTISLDKVVSLKAENLRPVALVGVPKAKAAAKQKAEGSLASLLGFGRKDPPQEKANQEAAGWQSLWTRNSSAEAVASTELKLGTEELSFLQSFNQDAEKAEQKKAKRAQKVEQELSLQGIVDPEVVREVIRQREEDREQLILLRGKAAARDSSSSSSRGRKSKRSRSSSSSSSSKPKDAVASEAA